MERKKYHSIEFKRRVIEDILNGVNTASEACCKCGIPPEVLSEWNLQYNLGRFDNNVHGISAPLAYLAPDINLRPSMPSAYIRVLRMFESIGASADTAHTGPFVSSN